MNYKRVLAGGILAGIVFVIGDALFTMVFSAASEAWLAALNLQAPTGGALVGAMIVTIAVGVVAVWLYAAIRPRYGAGLTTAVYAGLVVWALVAVVPSVSFAMLGMAVDGGFWIYLIWWLVFGVGGTVAGAWAYQESGEADVSGSPALAVGD